MKIEHILIPTDLSTEALRPCGPMGELARDTGARITLLHVVQDLRFVPHGAPFAPAVSVPDIAFEIDAARTQLEQQAKEIGPEVQFQIEVVAAEKIAAGICAYAKEHGVDLIALSTHGRTGFRHLVMGSVAEAVVRHSEIPVLAFPRKAS
jgi:nucleotide-binding universal stress UspA family protein